MGWRSLRVTAWHDLKRADPRVIVFLSLMNEEVAATEPVDSLTMRDGADVDYKGRSFLQ